MLLTEGCVFGNYENRTKITLLKQTRMREYHSYLRQIRFKVLNWDNQTLPWLETNIFAPFKNSYSYFNDLLYDDEQTPRSRSLGGVPDYVYFRDLLNVLPDMERHKKRAATVNFFVETMRIRHFSATTVADELSNDFKAWLESDWSILTRLTEQTIAHTIMSESTSTDQFDQFVPLGSLGGV